MNIIVVALIILAGALIPFGIGIYKDANEKMKNLKESIKEHEEYIKQREKVRPVNKSEKEKRAIVHA